MNAPVERQSVFSPEIETFGEMLLHHQCWFFGRDIWHPGGNLLIRYGFERIGAPRRKRGSDRVPGTNRYRYRGAGIEINLWGFGVFFGGGNGEGVFIKRYDFRPRLIDRGGIDAPVFKTEHLPPNKLARGARDIRAAQALTIGLIEWFLGYEAWIARECGRNWRRRNLREWEKSEFRAHRIEKNWLELIALIKNINV